MYRNLMEVERPSKKPTKIIIGKDATPRQRLLAIFFGPLLLAICFLEIHHQEYGSYLPSLDFILACSVFSIPFAFLISFKLYKTLGTKVILTDQKIIKKSSSGAELHLYWSDLKKIYITQNDQNKCIHLIFTRKNRSVPFDNANRICCPPGAIFSNPFSKTNLPGEAAGLILKKIELYKIPVKGDTAILQEIVGRTDKSSHTPAIPAVPPPLKTGRKRLAAGSSSSQTPTPK